VQDFKQVALDLVTTKLNAKLERDRERTVRRQQRYERQQRRYERQQRRDLARQLSGSHPVAAWATASLVSFVIWLIIMVTTGATYPWFVWVAGPWGAVLLGRYLSTRDRHPSG
jgi:Flp pilus assembly protein TadB